MCRTPMVRASATDAPRALLRESILRDLAWLMNSTRLEASVNLDAYPHVQRSVVNFGIDSLAGCGATVNGGACIENALREAIARFEPRILADSIEVRCLTETEVAPHTRRPRTGLLELEISGLWWSGDTPQSFLLRTDIDIENRRITLRSPGLT
nr:hypothetical protein HUO10_001844 [Paraburkholderia busanensis]